MILAGILILAIGLFFGFFYCFFRHSKKELNYKIEKLSADIYYAQQRQKNRENEYRQKVIILKSMIPIYKKEILFIQKQINNLQ